MQNPRERDAETRRGWRSGVQRCGDTVCTGFTDTALLVAEGPSTNEAWQEEDPAVTSMHARTAPAPGLTSPSEIQTPYWRATFQRMETVVAKFGVEDNL